ncbi:hypothetical protein C4587_00940 [Candidatus Parcubacteria bacterium]|nr:MAG: hypothetical protein C4587_00940 [Candidatus Parcubacteria bacterium]
MASFKTLAVVSALALASCASTGGGAPPLVTYSVATQRQAAAELRKLPKDSALARMIVDYGKQRAAIRAGRK